MTGDELADALIRTAKLVRMSGRVNGLDLEVLPGARLVVMSASGERMRAHRARTQREHNAHKSVTQGEQNANNSPSSLYSDPDSILDLPPDPKLRLPGSSSQNLTGSSGKKRDAGAAKIRKAKWTRVPADWEPNDGHRELARNKNVTFDDELASFRDHEFDKPKTDADAAFRNWLRKPWKGGPKNGTASAQSGIGAALGFAAEVMAQGAKQ